MSDDAVLEPGPEPPRVPAAGPRFGLRLAVAGVALAALLGAAAATSAACARAARSARPAPPRTSLVAVRPGVVRFAGPTLPATRAGAAARLLLGLALGAGLVRHLRRAPRVRWGASAAALLAATWALGGAVERGLRPAEATWLLIDAGGQRVPLTPAEVCLGAALGLLAVLGLGRAWTARRAGAPQAAAPVV